jgi:hypothetical protein
VLGIAEGWGWRRARSGLVRVRARLGGVGGLIIGAAGVGWLWGWLATGPAVSMGINWDTAAYGAEIASGRQGWSARPWSSHVALGPIYVSAAAVLRVLGGTVLDGLRAVGALALAVTAALMARMAWRLSGSRWVGAVVTAIWLASWGLITLVCTWEDNVLFLPFAAGALALALARSDRWRLGDSLGAGLIVGAGSLVSWQAAVYLFPALYVCLVFGGAGRSAGRRAAEAGALLAAFVATRVGWVVLYALTSQGLSFRELLITTFARPEPSYFPRGLGGWMELARAWRAALRHVATGLAQVVGPWPREAAPRGTTLVLVGGLILGAALAAWAITYRRARRIGATSGHILAATAVGLLFTAALYVDLPVDKYKRYDFIPMLAALGLSALVGAWRGQGRSPSQPATGAGHRVPRTPLYLLAVLLAGELVLALAAHARFRAALPSRQPTGYHSRGGETWFAFARRLRDRTPDRCAYLFTFAEVRHARYQLEIVAALWSELPGAGVLGVPEEASRWRRPLPTPAPGASPPACAWVSPDARPLLP